MADERGKRLLDLLADALDVDPPERDAWLRDACAGDEPLRAGVLELLAREDDAARLFDNGETSPEPPGSTDTGALAEGSRLDDYAIERRIGAGGMGVVYRAKQLSLNRTVALKVLPHHLRSSSRGLERFRREVEAAARLHHPNIVTVFASGDDGSTAFYAMEYVDGPSLSRVIESLRLSPVPEVRGSDFDSALVRSDEAAEGAADESTNCALLPHGKDDARSIGDEGYFERVARLLAGVADGLHYAHRNGVVHRDIKPSNLWFSGDGRLRIGDFGLARVASEPSVTQTGEVVGTPYYMAPEQLAGGPDGVNARTDVYAVGSTLYELLTLQPPFPGETRDVVLASIASEDPRPPRRVNRRTPRDLQTICLKAMAKRPGDRYETASDLAADLRRFADRMPVAARRMGPLHRGVRWCERHPPLAAAVLVSIILAGLAATLAMRAQHLATSQSKAASRVAEVATDLEEAQAQVAAANESEQERLFQAAMLAGMQGDADAVAAVLLEAENRGGSEARLAIARGQVHLFQGAFDKAITEFSMAADRMPERVAPRALLAESFARAGQHAVAATRRSEVVSMTPNSVEDFILLGRMELQFDPRRARRALDRAIDRDRRNIVARLIRGSARAQVAYLENDPAEAEKAVEDLRLAESLLDETPYLLGQFVNAHLIASAGYDGRGDQPAANRHLEAAEALAQRLGDYSGDYDAHRWRAFYFERAGDLDAAIAEWQAIDDKTIGYLIMCLYRAGRFDEALAACDDYRAHTSTGTADFCHSFVVAATADDPDDLTADFRFEDQMRWDPTSAWYGLHTLWRLAGDPERAMSEVESLPVPPDATEAMRTMHAYLVGDLPSAEYLSRSVEDRRDLAWAHMLIGIEQLGAGQRALARTSLDAVLELRLAYAFPTAVSRALLAQLDREPDWPAWIAAGDAGE